MFVSNHLFVSFLGSANTKIILCMFILLHSMFLQHSKTQGVKFFFVVTSLPAPITIKGC